VKIRKFESNSSEKSEIIIEMSITIKYMYNDKVCEIKSSHPMTSDDLKTAIYKTVKEIWIKCDILTINQDLPLNFREKIILIEAKSIKLHKEYTFDLFETSRTITAYCTITSVFENEINGQSTGHGNDDVIVYDIQKHESKEIREKYLKLIRKRESGDNTEIQHSKFRYFLRTGFFDSSIVYTLKTKNPKWRTISVNPKSYFLAVGTYNDIHELTKGRRLKLEIDHVPPKSIYIEFNDTNLKLATVLKNMDHKDKPSIMIPHLIHRALETTKYNKIREKQKLHMQNGSFSSAVLENIISYQNGFSTICSLWEKTDAYINRLCLKKTNNYDSKALKNQMKEMKEHIETSNDVIELIKQALNAYIDFIGSRKFGGENIALINDKEIIKLRNVVELINYQTPYKLEIQDFIELGNEKIREYYNIPNTVENHEE